MLGQLISFEIRSFFRQPIFWISSAAFTFLGLLFGRAGLGGPDVFVNSPFSLTMIMGLLSMGSIISVALFAGWSVLRDDEFRTNELLLSMPVSHWERVVSRFSGLFCSSWISFSFVFLGLFFALFMPESFERIGTISIRAYLFPWICVALPNIFLVSSILFAVATFSRNALMTYLSGVLLYVLYIVGSMLGNSPLMAQSAYVDPIQLSRMSLMDPFGLVSFIEQARYWTLDEKNHELIQLVGSLLINRLIWISFSLFILGFAIRGFSIRLKPASKKVEEPLESHVKMAVKPVETHSAGFRFHFQTFFSQFMIFTKQSLRSYPVLALVLFWTFLCAVEIIQRSMSGEMGIPHWPVLEISLPPLVLTIQRLGGLIVIFFVSEWIGLIKKTRIWEIHHTLPITNFNQVLCVFSCLLILIGLLLGTPLMVGYVFQSFQWNGSIPFSFLGQFLVRTGVPLLSVGALAIFIQWRLGRAVGLALSFAVIITFSGVIAQNSVFEFPLLRMGYLPEFEFSLMANTNYFMDATTSYSLFWLASTLVLLILTWWITQRRAERTPLWLGLFTSFLFGLSLWSCYRQLKAHDWQPRKVRFDQFLAYENAVAPFENQQLPIVTHAQADVTLAGELRTLEMQGSLILKNPHDQSLDSFLVSFSNECDTAELELEGAQLKALLPGLFLLTFDQHLQPGQSTTLSFDVRSNQSAFEALNSENYVLEEASYVELDKLMPQLGTLNDRKLVNSRERRQRGLEPLPGWPDPVPDVVLENRLIYDVTVRTSAGQTVVCPGDLIESELGDQPRFRYVTDLIPDGFALSSAVYEELKAETNSGVPVSFYVRAGHDDRAEEMLERAVQSLETFSTAFGPFPYQHLRLAEIPSFSDRFGGTSYPTCIYLVENRVFTLRPNENNHNLALRGIGHEVSHQWWGGHVQPYFGSGYRMMTEVLAMYSESLIGDQDGEEHFLNLVCDKYFFYRGFDEEVPLSEIEDQSFAYYFKGAFVMAAFKKLAGEKVMNEVLREFAEQYAMPNRPISKDLLSLFYEAFPEQRDWIHEWFETVTTYDLRILNAKLKTTANGYEVKVQIQATQFTPEGISIPTKPLELAIFEGGRELVRKEVYIENEKSWVSLQVPEKGDLIVLDPSRLWIDSNFHDQKRQIQLSRQ